MDSTGTHYQCLVIQGPNQGSFPVVGKTIRAVKRSLATAFSISYFAEAHVNGWPTPVAYILRPGDRLEFIRRLGFKGAEDRPKAQVEADAFLEDYPDLLKIGERVKTLGLGVEESIDMMTVLVEDWCATRFGPPTPDVMKTLAEVAERVAGAKFKPGKRGRRPTTAGRAYFAAVLESHGWTRAQIKEAWNEARPDDPVDNVGQIRDAVRRHCRGKGRQKN
jgi:hypothetical protein